MKISCCALEGTDPPGGGGAVMPGWVLLGESPDSKHAPCLLCNSSSCVQPSTATVVLLTWTGKVILSQHRPRVFLMYTERCTPSQGRCTVNKGGAWGMAQSAKCLRTRM